MRGSERLATAHQNQGGGEKSRTREDDENRADETRTLLTMLAGDTIMEGTETGAACGGKDTVGTEETKAASLYEEAGGTLISEEESPVISPGSEEETESTGGSEEQLEEEGIPGTLSSPPLLATEEEGRSRRRGRVRHRVRGMGRVQETKKLLASRTYCSHTKMQMDIKSLLHLGPSGREEELSFTTFDKCVDPGGCGIKVGPVGTAYRCPGCIVRQTGTGFSPFSTGKRLLRFKTL